MNKFFSSSASLKCTPSDRQMYPWGQMYPWLGTPALRNDTFTKCTSNHYKLVKKQHYNCKILDRKLSRMFENDQKVINQWFMEHDWEDKESPSSPHRSNRMGFRRVWHHVTYSTLRCVCNTWLLWGNDLEQTGKWLLCRFNSKDAKQTTTKSLKFDVKKHRICW